jgi:hypothetical protein
MLLLDRPRASKNGSKGWFAYVQWLAKQRITDSGSNNESNPLRMMLRTPQIYRSTVLWQIFRYLDNSDVLEWASTNANNNVEAWKFLYFKRVKQQNYKRKLESELCNE